MNRLVRIGWMSLVELLCMLMMSLEKVEEENRVVELEYMKFIVIAHELGVRGCYF